MNKQKWIDYAVSVGFENFEIYEQTSRRKVVKWFQGSKESFVTSRVTGLSLRGIWNGHMANVSTEDEDDAQMERVIRAMQEQAESVTSNDKQFIRSPEEVPELHSTRRWIRPTEEQIETALGACETKLRAYDTRIVQVILLQWIEDTEVRAITNSCGIDLKEETTQQYLIAGAAAMQGDEIVNNYTIEPVADLTELDLDAFVEKTDERVLEKLGSGPIASGSYKVIIEREAMSSLFSALTDIYGGDRIAKGMSILEDKIGTKIFADCISVVDEPGLATAVTQAAFDDEGCPTAKKLLVENGIFRQPLHNTASAALMNTTSTGNGFRSGYTNPVAVRPMNCYIIPGTKTLRELCENMGDGIVITEFDGLHAGLNHANTDFSLQSSGYLVKNGTKEKAVSLITAAGNFLDLMKHAVEVGNDLEWDNEDVSCPSIAFSEISIAGE